MKRSSKILLTVLGIVFGLGVIIFVSADIVVSSLVTKEVNKQLAEMPAEFGEFSFDGLHIRLFSGTAGISDIRYTYRAASPKEGEQTPGVQIHIGHIEIGRLFYSQLLAKRVLVSDIHIYDPRVELWLDEQHPEYSFPVIDTPSPVTGNPSPVTLLKNLRIYDASLALHSLTTRLDVAVDSCSLTVHDLAYDSVFHYNDSVYSLSIAHAAVRLPDGQMRMEVNHFLHQDAGEIRLGATRICHTMPKTRLADIVQEPVTWMDMQLESVVVSPLNPIRLALGDRQHFTVNHIDAVVGFMDIFRDERYKPHRIYGMPQPLLMALPVTFDVVRTEALIKKIHIAYAATDTNIGHLAMQHIHAGVDHITNRHGAAIHLSGHCPFGTGEAKAAFDLFMNEQCEFGIHIHAAGINTSVMDPFIRPLVGMTSDCVIDTLDAHYTGTDVVANGTYRMLYHGFTMRVHEEDDIPFRIITKNAKTFNTLGNTLIPKSNPRSGHTQPHGYYVSWKRNEKKPTELYLFGPIIDGIKKTFLPDLYVHMRTKNNEIIEVN